MRGLRVVGLLVVLVMVSAAWQAASAASQPTAAVVRDALVAETGSGGDTWATAAGGKTARVWIEPDDLEVEAGETFTVTLMVEGAVDLAGYEFALTYDPASLQGQDAQDGGFLDDTGRAVTELGPDIDNSEGSLTFAAFSLGTTEPGVDGSGPLALIRMQASAPVESSDSMPQQVSLWDTEDNEYDRVVIGLWRLFLPLILRSYGP